MKAPLLLGNDIRKMDPVALAVVKNKDALAISQDSIGVQAQRVWTGSSIDDQLMPGFTAAAVAARCDAARPTQAWQDNAGVLTTTDADGVTWCLEDTEGSEAVGSWRGVRCSGGAGTPVQHRPTTRGDNATAVLTRSGAHLTLNNALGASGPVPHSRYISADPGRSPASSWLRQSVRGPGPGAAFQLMHSDRTGVRDDDKAGALSFGGDWCLDLAQDADSEVWAGPLADEKWAVALLNRHPTANATITVDYSMFNATAGSSFTVKDIWAGAEAGTHMASYAAVVPPQGVVYMLLTPA